MFELWLVVVLKESQLNGADEFKALYIQCILSKQSRLMEIGLYDLKLLCENDLIDGDAMCMFEGSSKNTLSVLVDVVKQC